MKADYGPESNLNLKMIVVIARMISSMESYLKRSIAETGLTPGQFDVLETLYHQGPMTVNQIIEKTLSSSGNIDVVIGNLLKSGMVVKKINPDDRRSRIVELTERSFQVIRDFFPEHLKAVNRCLAGLGEDEKKLFLKLAKKLGKSIPKEN